MTDQPLLSVKDLHTQFRTDEGIIKAVDGVSFDIKRGETVAIVGESGSGKSITAMSILGLIPNPPGEIVSGEILFEGKDLIQASESELRNIRGNDISMIFQEPMTSLNPSLTIGKQLAEPIVVHTKLNWKEALKKAIGFLGKVQIADAENRIKEHPHQFSGGMRQRVMIAMGLGCEPKLIIADEPTTALDVTVQAQILELLKDLTRNNDTSLLLITHDLGVVARYAERVNVMYAGRIVESGSVMDVFHNPQHPYTKGLLASIPRMDQDAGDKLVPIIGSPPDLSMLPTGCAFHPRCPVKTEECTRAVPPLKKVGPYHHKACWING
ncbi:MAG: ABC transporter ATP-binding protein [Sneathiella sp.]|nr:ABC transporter ATP-binding protein [Sneathiella sp.]